MEGCECAILHPTVLGPERDLNGRVGAGGLPVTPRYLVFQKGWARVRPETGAGAAKAGRTLRE